MKISEQWLRTWTNTSHSTQILAEQFTQAGLEIDDISARARDFSGVVVAKVVQCAPHPDADRLRVVRVDVGDEILQIVCGAPNVRENMQVACAKIGAILPTDDKPFVIKSSKLRGVLSCGMLCSAKELGISDEADGLLELSGDAPIGEDIRKVLALDDVVFDIAITPNRGDCLSMMGLAREICAINNLPINTPDMVKPIIKDDTHGVCVQLQANDACLRYFAQYIDNINPNTTTPLWMQNILSASSVRLHNFLVDVTNFVMLETGQPMHAFDAQKIVGDIVVRLAKKGETLQLLNDAIITLLGDELVIADDEGVIALAGIMGGARTAVSDTTRAVILESAHFVPTAIANRARRFGLHTDASARFERGVDYNMPKHALERAAGLLQQYASAQAYSPFMAQSTKNLPKPLVIDVPISSIARLLGVHIDAKAAKVLLQRVQIDTQIVQKDGDTLLACTIPSHRFDLSIPQNIIGELARLYGYQNIDDALPVLHARLKDEPAPHTINTIKARAVSAGYFEAISFSFSDAKLQAHFDDNSNALALANPISSELSVMRCTLLSSLLPIVQYNLNRKQTNVRLFETGLAFLADDGGDISKLQQINKLALIATGEIGAPNAAYAMDFYDIKHDVLQLLPSNVLPTSVKQNSLRYERANLPFLHPGQSAKLLINHQDFGYFGRLHPSICQAQNLPDVFVAELDLDKLVKLYAHYGKNVIEPISKFPQVRRDLAIVVDKSVSFQDVLDVVRQSGGAFLQDAWLFDEYHGEKIGTQNVSLAFAMIWQHPDKTLDDAEIKGYFDDVIAALECTLKATLRN